MRQFLARLASVFRRTAPRPGPYALDDPEQDGPAWHPEPEARERFEAQLREALRERFERDRAAVASYLDEDPRAAARRLLDRLPADLRDQIAAEAARRGAR